jgi:hypothetical protein
MVRSQGRSRVRRALLAAGSAVAVVLGMLAVTLNAQASVPTTPTGWSLVFSDDFTGAAGTLPSSGNWIFDSGHSYAGGPGNWGTGEIQSFTNSASNIALDGNGNLRITPVRDGAGNWTSARIETQRTNFKPAVGSIMRVEGRIQMPNVTGAGASGYWPAFWMLGAPYRGNYQNWPSIGELDVMENVNGINSVWGTLHCGVNPGGPCNETTGLGASRACPNTTCQSAFHAYRFEWDRSVNPEQLRWYVDGVQYHSVSQSQVDATTWSNMTSHNGYFILLNVSIGGAFPDAIAGATTPTSSTTSGAPMVVDYVAVWNSGTSTPSPTATASPSPTPTGSTVDAYSTIQAEAFNAQSGAVVEACSEGGQDIGSLRNGDWARYDNVNFGSTRPLDFVTRVASGAAGGISGLVEVRLDSTTSPPIGSFALANTGGWQTWTSVPGNVSAVTGVHTVYLTFTSGQPNDFVNVNWFTFRH